MNDAPEPQWDKLPHDPEAFFELGESYELRDLKRSYNRLIRRFKPERHPQEFQRIRAAYESLFDALRYNAPRPTGESQPWKVEIEFPPPETPPTPQPPRQEKPKPSPRPQPTPTRPQSTPAPRPVPVESLPDSTSPALLYRQFAAKENKLPSDFMALAILSDLTPAAAREVGTQNTFLDWLLAGLAENPRDWGLARLLRACLKEPEHDIAQLPAILRRAVMCLPADRFQYCTEPAWDRLIREAPQEEFRAVFERCGRKLSNAVDHSLLTFYLHLLKPALWKCDPEFVQDLCDTLEDHYFQLNRWSEREYETLDRFRIYLEHRQAFIARGPCCARIDQAMRDWCLLPESEGDLSVLECQYFLSANGRQLLREFPDPNEDCLWLLKPWRIVVRDVRDRIGDPQPVPEKTLEQHSRDFLHRVTYRNSQRRRYIVMQVVFLLGFALSFALGAGFLASLARLLYHAVTLAGLATFGLDLLLAAGLLVSAVVLFAGAILCRYSYNLCPYAVARGEMINLMRLAPLPQLKFISPFKQFSEKRVDSEDNYVDTHAIRQGLRADDAMEIFSLAMRCLSAVAPEEVVDAEVAAIEPIILE